MIRSLLVALFVLLIQACSLPSGLPAPEELPYHTRGAQIRVSTAFSEHLYGELIAVNGEELLVLPHDKRKEGLVAFQLEDLHSFRVYYAEGPDLLWAVIVYSLTSFSHGVWFVISLPVNLVATSVLRSGAVSEYILRPKDITPDELRRFARFPQGIPEHIDEKSIR